MVGVWVGNSDYQAMRDVNGLTGAAPIWQETIRSLLRGKPVESFIQPDGLVRQAVCTFSGLLPTPLCARTGLEWFLSGTQPTQPDNIYKQIWLDSATGALAGADTPANQREALTVLDLPVQAQRWAHSQGLRLFSDFSGDASQSTGLNLISPQPGAAYSISSQLDPTAQQLPVQALAGPGLTDISIWVDGQQTVRFNSAPYVAWWPLAPGMHRFWAQGFNASGQVVRSETVEITVTK